MIEEPAIEEMMEKYSDTLLRLCYLYLKDYQLAEDIVQDTFIKAIKNYDSFKHESSEKTWLTRIAINNCKNALKSYDHGSAFYSPLDLELRLVLSDEQMKTGLNDEYLGYYEYEDNVTSVQGYKVNVLKSTSENESEQHPKRIAVFVADGIQYKLSGQVSKDTILEVINSME